MHNANPISRSQARRFAATHPRAEAEIIADLRQVEGDLSPENLTCDGELAPSVVRRRHAALMHKRGLLVAELGREPSFKEIWGI